MSQLLPLVEAQARLLALAEPLGTFATATRHSLGHYLAEPLVAARTQPAADLSAMDGYAVRGDDLTGPWQVVGESAAGHPFPDALQPGEAVRISTGALLPAEAGAVLLQENALRENSDLARCGADGPDPRHVRRSGLDFRSGNELLPAGTHLGPAQLALALASGAPSVALHNLPSVAIIDSGDELADDPADCGPHQVPASNGAMLAGMCARLAADVHLLGPVADSLAALGAALEQAGDADVIVTSGGASVGDHDLIQPALAAWGAEIAFWKVAIRPGKPLLVARKGRQMVLGLPGNPVSSYVTAFLFLLPLLRRLAGAAEPLPEAIPVPLAAPLPAGGTRTEFYRAVIGAGSVTPLFQRDSSALRTLATANALIERPAGCPAAEIGDHVPTYWLGNGGMA